ncbi:anhydro-N-acetylmuramic acid kinase [Pseudoalteromonas ruthenica]|uniref:anhydro-N-acetylmuramic acid kinase n=1 Tax=Pseudoalteromonas ruthenica TaxID=151081 RepID=UPI001244BB9B|nr:anhydro-N-acetylmuramic acid kinase [Pseudoalteromonas ruthenica]
MHPHIHALYELSAKPQRTIVGLMSGTSMDGLDVALCRVSGAGRDTRIEVEHFTTCAYPKEYSQRLRQVFAKRDIDLQHLTLLNAWVGRLHGQLVKQCLAQWQVNADEVDAIASHGQTVYHCPKAQHGLDGYPNATLQIGDGCHVACTSGILTISDFRQKHIAAGGEGAPLAAYGDYLYFASTDEHRVLLNLGGIANITLLPKAGELSDTLCADLGPGNTMLDAYVQRYFAPRQFDENSTLARQGQVHEPLLAKLSKHPFLHVAMPKTTGPEVFNLAYLAQCQAALGETHLAHEDVLATLCEFAAYQVGTQLARLAKSHGPLHVYASGGGVHNPLLMARIAYFSGEQVQLDSLTQLGMNPDAKEAVLFALLANETLVGQPAKAAAIEGMPQISMGKLSFPD